MDLLGQLLEDIVACQDKMGEEGGDGFSRKKLKEFGSFVGEFQSQNH